MQNSKLLQRIVTIKHGNTFKMSNLLTQKVSDVKIIWQDCHNRAWECVSNFIAENLTQFVGRTVEAESTVMPASRAWLRDQAKELGNSPEDHGIILFLNCPAIGVMSAARLSFILNYISNVLADFPLNSVCFVVHPNRAQQEGRRWGDETNLTSLHRIVFWLFGTISGKPASPLKKDLTRM